jgi:hypothetical protein
MGYTIRQMDAERKYAHSPSIVAAVTMRTSRIATPSCWADSALRSSVRMSRLRSTPGCLTAGDNRGRAALLHQQLAIHALLCMARDLTHIVVGAGS